MADDNTVSIRYKFRDRNNRRPLKATCAECLEESKFRIISVDNVNHVQCIRCLKYTRYNKKFRVAQHPIVYPLHLDWKKKIVRSGIRLKRWILGDHVYAPFGRKRKAAKW